MTTHTPPSINNKCAQGSIFIIAAASGTGKTSLVKELIQHVNNLDVSVSHTTRNPREGEINGKHYHFTNVDTFKQLIDDDNFLEHAEVFGNYYGTSKQSVQDQLDKGIDVILEIDWQGALQVKECFSDVTMIFILPPSREELKKRLSNRGQDSQEVIQTRLAGALTEMTQYDKFDYLVVNNDFEKALNELTMIVLSNRLHLKRQQVVEQELLNKLLSN